MPLPPRPKRIPRPKPRQPWGLYLASAGCFALALVLHVSTSTGCLPNGRANPAAVTAVEGVACALLVALDSGIPGTACQAVAGVLNAGLRAAGVMGRLKPGPPRAYPVLVVDGHVVAYLPAELHDDARAILAAHPEAMAALKAGK